MALAFTALDDAEEAGTDGTQTSASISPPDGAVLYVVVASSVPASGPGHTHGVSGLSGTWAAVVTETEYGRRAFSVWRGTKATAWGSGSLTITASATGLQDMAYVIDQVTGVDDVDPDDAPVSGSGSDSLTLGDVGTPDAGDAVYVVACHEDGDNSLNATGYTLLSSLQAMTNIRQIETYYDDSSPDETPNITSSGGGNGIGAAAFIINVGSAPPASVGLIPVILQNYRNMGYKM